MSGRDTAPSTKPISRRRGASLSIWVAVTAALIIVISNAASIVVQYSGFPLLGYQGRNAVTRRQAVLRLTAAAEAKQSLMDSWIEDRINDAKMIAQMISVDVSPSGLAAASMAGWPDAERGQALHLGGELAATVPTDGDVQSVQIVARPSGRVLADSSTPPFGRAEDASWLGSAPALRMDAEGRCVIGLPISGRGGARMAVLLYASLDALFRQIRTIGLDSNLNMDLAVLDADSRVLDSSDSTELPRGALPLPLPALKLLKNGAVREVTGSEGQRLLAGAFTFGGGGGPAIPLRLFVVSHLSSIEETMRADRSAAVTAALLATLIGLLLVWLSLRRLFAPLAGLEAAIEAFTREERRLPLPRRARGDIAVIADAMGGLMDQVSDWRRHLEREVLERTAELRARSEAATLFANVENDESVYSGLVALIARSMDSPRALFVLLRDSAGMLHTFPPKPSLALTEEEVTALQTAIDSPQVGFSSLGLRADHHLGRRVEIGSGVAALIVVLSDSPIEEARIASLDSLIVELFPLLRARAERRRQEAARLEAEQSLRRSEERLRTFFEDSRDMIYTTNADDVIASMNSAGLALLGYRDRFEVVGRQFSVFAMNKDDRLRFLEKIKTQGYASDFEIVLKRSNGDNVFCLETAQAVMDRRGGIIEIQGIVKDITDRIDAERELWRANMELGEANTRLKGTQMMMVQHEKLASIGQLAAGVAHEINNPLGFLKSNHGVLAGYFATVRNAWLEAETINPDTLGAISKRAELDYVFREIDSVFKESDEGYRRIMDIVSNLRSFARTEAEVAFAAYDLNKGIESTLTVARNEIKYVAEVELRLGELPSIDAAGGEINQVLLNLIVNSAQAIAEQKRSSAGHIRIATGLIEDRVYCTVSDDGPGIPEESRLKVLDPFFTTKEPGKGTGLGLSISYDIIVSKHGGRLLVDQSPEGGALFRFELPIRHAEPPAVQAAQAPPAAPQGPPAS